MRLHDHHEGDRQKQIGEQRDARDHAGKAIVNDHEHQYREESDAQCKPALDDSVFAERGPHGVFTDRLRLERGRQGARFQDVGEIVDFLLGEAAADLPLLSDCRSDGRRGHNLAVEDDGEVAEKLALVRALTFGDVLGGHVVEQVAAVCIEAELHDRLERAGIKIGLSTGKVGPGDGLRFAGFGIDLRIAHQQEVFDSLLLSLFRRELQVLAIAAIEQ